MKIKKAFSIFLVLTLLLGTFAVNVTAATDPWVGTAGYSESRIATDSATLAKVEAATDLETVTSLTAGADYKITSVAGLQNFAKLVNAGKNFKGNTVYLANDITNNETVFTMDPIGKFMSSVALTSDPGYIGNGVSFQGVFDGRGHTIDYLSIESSEDGQGIALFGAIIGAEIRNLKLGAHCVFTNNGTSGTERTAAVVAFAQIHNNHGLLSVLDEAGAATSGCYLIENIYSEATVSAKAGCAGGVIGHIGNRGTNHLGMVRYATVYGEIRVESSAGYVGGLGGAATASSGTRKVHFYNSNVGARIIGANRNSICNVLASTSVASDGHNFSFCELIPLDYDASAIGYSFGNVGNRITSGTNINDTDTFNTTTNYIINDAQGLKKLATLSASSWFDSVKIYLTADIDMSGITDMTPIGPEDAHQFCGIFDGQGYVIDNLSITVENGYAGLFGVLDSATVRNVVLGDGCTFTGKYAGAVTGAIKCRSVKVTVMENCYSEATVSGTTAAGGLVGYTYGNNNKWGSVLRNLTNAGDVTSGTYAGGIVGHATRTLVITHCRNAGSVSGSGSKVGALIGEVTQANKIVHNYANDMSDAARWIGVRGNQVGPYADLTNKSGVLDETWDVIQFVGYQTKTENQKVTALRVLAVVNDLDSNVGFKLSATDGNQAYTYQANQAYNSVLANENGVNVSVQAETFGGKYLIAVTISGIPAAGTTITVEPFEGSYTGDAVNISLNVA